MPLNTKKVPANKEEKKNTSESTPRNEKKEEVKSAVDKKQNP